MNCEDRRRRQPSMLERWGRRRENRNVFWHKAGVLLVIVLAARPSSSIPILRGGYYREVAGHSVKSATRLSNDVEASRSNEVREPPPRRAQVIDIRLVDVELTVALHFVDHDTAALFAAGDPENPVVQRFCTAVNRQAGGSQARQLAEDDSLTLFTRDDYEYPETGCEILGTNQMHTYGDPPGPNYSSLEISFRQEVFVSPTDFGNLDDGDIPLADRVARYSSAGFDKGGGGRARFRKRLKNVDPEPVPAFDTVEDVDLIDELSPPMARPTSVPSTKPTSASPTLYPTTWPTVAPATGAPIRTPTWQPTTTPAPTDTTRPPMAPTLPPVTDRPTLLPDDGATDKPTATSSEKPSGESTAGDSDQANVNAAETSNAEGTGPKAPTAAIAAAAGAGLGILAVGLFTLWRCKTDDDGIHGSKSRQPPTNSASPPTRPRRSNGATSPSGGNIPPAPPSATSSVARLGARRAPPVPSVVALPEGGEVGSVADSTLGDRTAGRKQPFAVRPPASILKSSMRHGIGSEGGWGSSSIAASSQISSLESGTIGAGGDRTLGGFSLEAAIKEGPAGYESEISPDTLFVDTNPADVESTDIPCHLNIGVAAAGAALMSAAAVREKGDEGKVRAPVGGETPTESLAGTTSLMGASYQSTMYSSSREDEKDRKLNATTASIRNKNR